MDAQLLDSGPLEKETPRAVQESQMDAALVAGNHPRAIFFSPYPAKHSAGRGAKDDVTHLCANEGL